MPIRGRDGDNWIAAACPRSRPVLGISETTVQTHLQHVFEKTGTKRQADLVKLVAGYMSPLAG